MRTTLSPALAISICPKLLNLARLSYHEQRAFRTSCGLSAIVLVANAGNCVGLGEGYPHCLSLLVVFHNLVNGLLNLSEHQIAMTVVCL